MITFFFLFIRLIVNVTRRFSFFFIISIILQLLFFLFLHYLFFCLNASLQLIKSVIYVCYNVLHTNECVLTHSTFFFFCLAFLSLFSGSGNNNGSWIVTNDFYSNKIKKNSMWILFCYILFCISYNNSLVDNEKNILNNVCNNNCTSTIFYILIFKTI